VNADAFDEERACSLARTATSATLLAELARDARDARDEVRANAAMNPFLAEDISAVLARDEDDVVRLKLAGNRAVPRSTQVVLARDTNPYVRATLVANPGLEVGEDFPLGFLKECYVGRELIAERMSTERVDPEDAAALARTWAGTLGELIATCAELVGEA
jgi:hypothetical protein